MDYPDISQSLSQSQHGPIFSNDHLENNRSERRVATTLSLGIYDGYG